MTGESEDQAESSSSGLAGAGFINGLLVGLALAVTLGACGYLAGYLNGKGINDDESTVVEGIPVSPAFESSELAEAPTENWLTNGGSLANQRYSPLDQINTGNVSQLKGVWRTHLDGSGTASKYSGEATPLVYDGVIYTVTGADDVFATSVETSSTASWSPSTSLRGRSSGRRRSASGRRARR